MPIYDDTNWRDLIQAARTDDGSPQWLPRQTAYASRQAAECGLRPMEDYPDEWVPWSEVPAAVEQAHKAKVFPLYHQERASVFSPWDQDGYGYCWAFGLTAAVMGCRAAEGQRAVRLSPWSLGWLVSWRNRGYFCDRAIEGAMQRGIAPVEYAPVDAPRPSAFVAGWEEVAKQYRPLEWWDVDTSRPSRDILRQCVTILITGRPLYVAYDWWGHALECVGASWSNGQLTLQLLNSHGDGVITLTGTKMVPTEAYGVRATTASG